MNTNAPQHEPDEKAADGRLPERSSFDGAIKAALHDLPVPSDLAERLIARIEAEELCQASTGKMPVPPESVTLRRIRPTRRHVLIAAGSLALAALFCVSIVIGTRAPREVAREDLSGDVMSWLSALPAKDWRSIATLPKAIEIDQAVAAQPRQWQTVQYKSSSGWSASVTAIDLASPTAPRAMLLVVRSRARFAVPTSPTATFRLGLSSGYAGTAWQRPSGELYVLVVQIDRGQRLEDFLPKPTQA